MFAYFKFVSHCSCVIAHHSHIAFPHINLDQLKKLKQQRWQHRNHFTSFFHSTKTSLTKLILPIVILILIIIWVAMAMITFVVSIGNIKLRLGFVLGGIRTWSTCDSISKRRLFIYLFIFGPLYNAQSKDYCNETTHWLFKKLGQTHEYSTMTPLVHSPRQEPISPYNGTPSLPLEAHIHCQMAQQPTHPFYCF